VAISHHGLGHLAQTAPVLHALAAQRGDLRLTIQSRLSREALEARIQVPFEHLREAADCGMPMVDALRVDVPAALACYRAFHEDWEARVAREAGRYGALGVEAVLGNVAYLPLAAAQRAGRPAVALCSLNWADIAAHYLGEAAGMAAILEEIRAAYRGALRFLRPTPAMPMPDLPNVEAIPPIAGRGRVRRAELRARLGLGAADRLVLIGMGGIGYRKAAAHWPRTPGICWLAPEDWCGGHPDFVPYDRTGMPFADLLASCDALVTKPGYGSFVEAAAQAVPVLYLERPDWPETPYLTAWLQAQGRALAIDEAVLEAGRMAERLEALWASGLKPPAAAEGAEEAARRLMELL